MSNAKVVEQTRPDVIIVDLTLDDADKPLQRRQVQNRDKRARPAQAKPVHNVAPPLKKAASEALPENKAPAAAENAETKAFWDKLVLVDQRFSTDPLTRQCAKIALGLLKPVMSCPGSLSLNAGAVSVADNFHFERVSRVMSDPLFNSVQEYNC